MYKSLIASLFLILLTSSSIFFILHIGINSTEEDQNHLNGYMKNAVYSQYDKEGQLMLHLSSPTVRHFSLKNNAEFEKPDILIYNGKKIPWHITALYGKNSTDNNLVDLWDQVVIHRAAADGQPETTIRTTALTINLKEQVAETNQAATITQPHSVVQSIGLKTDFKSGITQLAAHARVDYDGEGESQGSEP
ncbi:MAG TPA: LPS export ABC transporter periplasmic protein LptC [Coxiellaceae bacterium]|nr:LPS export ABC transporter periplasmic protein LptC [Coxiellaceae bacterium]